ncbi:mismatch repair ATPase [Anaerolinea thermolimosa]|uniref:MutS-related protein n=1 Tax=Anaerolinea thermolimosa TaxID=229919 RepID=UPI0007867327|nr:DNA mismatch repair protein MutS [Anaerolinea thermolimosa]GAP06860.1 mismatch repair ATPase [Anaerolinea thermolimosa]
MTVFLSVLFLDRGIAEQAESAGQPVYFPDLNLDQAVKEIVSGRQDYRLKPFFYTPLHDIDQILYRQEVGKDLENPLLIKEVQAFAEQMVLARRYLGLIDQLYFKNHKEGWFLESILAYGKAVEGLAAGISSVDLQSRGLKALRDYLHHYVESERFTAMMAEARKIKDELATIQYCVHIKGNWVQVRAYESEPDYSQEVEQTFLKFKQGAVKDYRLKLGGAGMSYVEAQILDCVAKLYPEIFGALDRFCQDHLDFMDETIRVFDREVQFYLAYFEFISRLKQAGLKFCYPQVSNTEKTVWAYEAFDIALANQCVTGALPVVTNDFELRENERIIVVTGPNQGGKTTFARMFGQIHYMASLGLPVPGEEAHVFLWDQIYTHFEKEEDIRNLRGKLQDDLVRIHEILKHATSDSILIMNEIFTSTSLKDATFLSKRVMEAIVQLDAFCVWVTFIDELTSYHKKTVSMVSTVLPDNPMIRTFKVIRKPADGLSFAIHIAKKYRLTYEQIKERIPG